MRKQWIERRRLGYSAVAGIAAVAFIQFLQLGKGLDQDGFDWLFASLICFAVSIPALAGAIYVLTIEANYNNDPSWAYRREVSGQPVRRLPWGVAMAAVSFVGLITGFFGIACLFFYFHTIAGLLFLVASALVTRAARVHERRREAEN